MVRKKDKKMPKLVKVISVLYYIGAALGLIFGILFIAGAGIIDLILEQMPEIAALGAGVFVLIGILLIVLSVVDFFVARGLWHGRNWARIVVMVFCVLGILTGLTNIVSNWFNILVDLAIGLYFYLNKEVKKAFA
jgi:hypothetical protein